MPRFVKLAALNVKLVAPADPSGPPADATAPPAGPSALPDLPVRFNKWEEDGTFRFDLPAGDPASFNVPAALHVGLYELGHDGLTSAMPEDPAKVVEAPYHFSLASPTPGAEAVVDGTDAPEGDYAALLVAEFAS